MNLIVCLDDKNGYSFASRRQTKDRVQLNDMLAFVGKNNLFLTDYSSALFSELPANVKVTNTPQKSAGAGDFCFIENITIDDINAEKIIIYRWNRSYPSDKKFSENLLAGKTLVSTTEFEGSSHEKITREVYE